MHNNVLIPGKLYCFIHDHNDYDVNLYATTSYGIGDDIALIQSGIPWMYIETVEGNMPNAPGIKIIYKNLIGYVVNGHSINCAKPYNA